MMIKNKFKLFSVLSLLVLASNQAIANGGIGLGATRVIYPLGATQATLAVTNTTLKQNYLINAWVDDDDEKKTNQFIITPPLFVSSAKAESTLRIVNIGPQLPTDRESLFYVSVKAIPAVDQEKNAELNVLNLAILSRVKMFVRPNNLKIDPNSAIEQITFSQSAQGIQAQNNSPYYLTLVNIKASNKDIESVMLAPKSSQLISNEVNANEIQFQNIDDFGALTTPLTKKIS